MKRDKTEYKTISKRSKELLKREEDYDVEFKESISSLDSSDFAAFANSEKGGTIFVGIREAKTKKGRQKPVIVGCHIDDREKQRILGKATTCIPPVNALIFVENSSNKKPFYRIEIQSGKDKPYSTSGGTYKIRGDGRVKALLAGDLLNMLMAREGEKFIARFSEATKQLENEIERTRAKMVENMEEINSSLESLAEDTESKLEDIFNTAQDAQSNAEEAMVFSDEAMGGIIEIDKRIDDTNFALLQIEENLKALSELLGFNQAMINKIKLKWKVKYCVNFPLPKKKGKKEILTLFKEMFVQYTDTKDSQIEELIEECLDEVKHKRGNKKK